MDLRFSVFQRVQIVVVILNDLSLSLSLSHTCVSHTFHVQSYILSCLNWFDYMEINSERYFRRSIN